MCRTTILLGVAVLPLLAAEDGRGLAAGYAAEVDRRVALSSAEADFYARYLKAAPELVPGQFALLVDRAQAVQLAAVFWRAMDGGWHLIGASPVSTGKPGRFDYFETPVGIFAHTLDNPDYRAEGTRNEYGIRGYGVKGMRVFDLGWTRAQKGWGDRREMDIRFQIHATDPVALEPRLGERHSKGCVRIPSTLNVFLDRYGILDADYQRAVQEGKRPLVLRGDWRPTPWAGRYVVVVDTSRVWLRRDGGNSRYSVTSYAGTHISIRSDFAFGDIDGAESGASAFAGANGRAETGAGDGGGLRAPSDPSRRGGGAAVSGGVAVSEGRKGARGRAVQHEPGGAGADQQYCEYSQSVD